MCYTVLIVRGIQNKIVAEKIVLNKFQLIKFTSHKVTSSYYVQHVEKYQSWKQHKWLYICTSACKGGNLVNLSLCTEAPPLLFDVKVIEIWESCLNLICLISLNGYNLGRWTSGWIFWRYINTVYRTIQYFYCR